MFSFFDTCHVLLYSVRRGQHVEAKWRTIAAVEEVGWAREEKRVGATPQRFESTKHHMRCASLARPPPLTSPLPHLHHTLHLSSCFISFPLRSVAMVSLSSSRSPVIFARLYLPLSSASRAYLSPPSKRIFTVRETDELSALATHLSNSHTRHPISRIRVTYGVRGMMIREKEQRGISERASRSWSYFAETSTARELPPSYDPRTL